MAFDNVEAAELYPCVVFYSSNPGEKVKITDMQVQGTQRDLLPGDPALAPLPAVLAESYIALIRKLHNSDSWTAHVNAAITSRFAQIKNLLPSTELEEPDMEALCTSVWPALCVVGGVDRGPKMGAPCQHTVSGMRAIVLGVLKKGVQRPVEFFWDFQTGVPGTTTVSVQWEQDHGVADVSISSLDFMEPEPFNTQKYHEVPMETLVQLLRLSGVTHEVAFPLLEFSEDELVMGAEPQTVDSLTDRMVSSILEDVARIRGSRGAPGDEDVARIRGSRGAPRDEVAADDPQAAGRQRRFAAMEGRFVKLAFLQFSALKTVGEFTTVDLLGLSFFTFFYLSGLVSSPIFH